MDIFEKYNVGKCEDFTPDHGMPTFTCPICKNTILLRVWRNGYELSNHPATCELDHYYERLNSLKNFNIEVLMEEIDKNYLTEYKIGILMKL